MIGRLDPCSLFNLIAILFQIRIGIEDGSIRLFIDFERLGNRIFCGSEWFG